MNTPGLLGQSIMNIVLTNLKPYLPSVPSPAPDSDKASAKYKLRKNRERFSLRSFVATQIYLITYTITHALFSVYRRIRIGYHGVRDHVYSVLKYHHRTPEIIARDVRDLKRLPKHLSVILTLEENGHGLAELERLVNEVSDIAAWCASAGIPMLSVYEKTG